MSNKLYELPLGIYEKAMPFSNSWLGILIEARQLGFSFVELSIDESSERIERLRWSKTEIARVLEAKQKLNMRIPTMCLSLHRKYPLGSAVKSTRTLALDIMKRAIDLADNLGIRVIQVAAYDVFYENPHPNSVEYFIRNLEESLVYATSAQVMLALETMDTEFLNSIGKYLVIKNKLNSPWLRVYPDVGNLSAWNNNTDLELNSCINDIVCIHIKDTQKVTAASKGQFRDVPFGSGCVNFKDVFAALKLANYQGPLVIEMWARKDLATARIDIVTAKNFIMSLLKAA